MHSQATGDWPWLDGTDLGKIRLLAFENGNGSIKLQLHWLRLYSQNIASTTMFPDIVPELSIEQLIGALNKKLSTECTRVQSALPPESRALVTTLAAEVRSSEQRESLGVDDAIYRSTPWKSGPKKFCAK